MAGKKKKNTLLTIFIQRTVIMSKVLGRSDGEFVGHPASLYTIMEKNLPLTEKGWSRVPPPRVCPQEQIRHPSPPRLSRSSERQAGGPQLSSQ